MRRLGLLALLAIAALGAGASWLEIQLGRPYRGHRPEKVFVDIPHGTSRWKTAEILKSNDIIRNQFAFAMLTGWHFRRHVQAGEYLFDQSVDSRQVFWKIVHGQIFVHTVLVPEGFTMYDIAAELDRKNVCSREDFLAAARDTSLISDLAPRATSLEGFLFPSTYYFTRHTTCEQVAKRMVQNFRVVWNSVDPAATRAESAPASDPPPSSPAAADATTTATAVRQAGGTKVASVIAPPAGGLTTSQLVTLASLVERETPDASERPMVAGVFLNRLKKGYGLQCDPTVAYAWALEGHIVRDVRPNDLKIDSPYNTYQHRGLPPGPIANPGEASLRAALQPAQTDYLYFVANGEGGHFFSRTLEEHNRNVARLRHLLAADAASAASAHPKQ
jgi:UPF0755 protein